MSNLTRAHTPFFTLIALTTYILLVQSQAVDNGGLVDHNNDDDATCIFDPLCQRGSKYCLFDGCCYYKNCFDTICSITVPVCRLPKRPFDDIDDVKELQLVDDKSDNYTCIFDQNCHRNATYCIQPGCCFIKRCDEKGQCTTIIPLCRPPRDIFDDVKATDIAEVKDFTPDDNQTCIFDPECHRDATYCIFEGCCYLKRCDEKGVCWVAIPRCKLPGGPFDDIKADIGDFVVLDRNKNDDDNQTCILDPECKRDATFCIFEGCCSYKWCTKDGICWVAIPRCKLPDDPKNDVLGDLGDVKAQFEETKDDTGGTPQIKTAQALRGANLVVGQP